MIPTRLHGATVSFTGHRPEKLGGYSPEAFDLLVDFAKAVLLASRLSHVVSGMALGWDQAVAVAAVETGTPFTAAIPFEGFDARWPYNSRERFRSIIGYAAKVQVVCESGYAPWKMQRRNEWMVDGSTATIALWNGTSGGTANCVAYAEGVGRAPYNVWDDWVEFSR